jgi:hypothetical protein
MKELERLYREWLAIPDPPAERGLRRCALGHLARERPGPCGVCGEAAAGLALAPIYTGEDEALAEDLARSARARSIVTALAAGIWSVAALRVLAWLVLDGIVRATFVLATTSVFALAFHAALVFVARLVLDVLRGHGSHGEHVEDLEAKLDAIADRVLEPFLSRVSIGEGAPLRAPPEELALLEQAFALEGLVPRHGALPLLLASAALRRDYRRFKERLAAAEPDDPHRAYARAIEGEALLPMLEELLAKQGSEPENVADLVRAQRTDRKLETFLGDLAERRAAGGVVVTIEALDAVSPASFEAIVVMLLETEGYAAKGPVLERHGEKTVAFARQEVQLLDTPLVQEALAARTQLACQHALVVTSSGFTDAARDLARANAIELVDRAALARRLDAFNKAPKDYARLAVLLKPRAA